MNVNEKNLRSLIKNILLEKKRKGLWYYVNKNKKSGRKPNHPNSKAYKAAKKAGEKLNREKKNETDETINEAIDYHLRANVGIDRNIFRPGSENFFRLFREVRDLYYSGLYEPRNNHEKELLESDIGNFVKLNGKLVPLDFPMLEAQEYLLEAEYKGRKVKLNKPIKGGSKGAYVYVKNDKGNVQKVEFGSSMPDAMGDSDEHKQRRKNFGDRHNCADKKDKTAPGYWSCRATKFFGRSIHGWW